MTKIENKIIQEAYYKEVLDNGLTVYLMPKNDYYKTYAIFSTKYGSRDTTFIPRGEKEYIKTPEGVAHFLEHKLFENEDGTDASNLFATFGADVNAFTTNSYTAYLFSTTSDVNNCVELLLDFVQTPYFTEKGIQKEQGIIEQELLMYLDQPQNVLYYGLLKGLYQYNSIRNEIGGTVDSIKEIDEDILYTCYNTFYHPSNMSLVIIGNFEADEMINLIKANQNKKYFERPLTIQRKYLQDEQNVYEKHRFIDMNVNIPKASLGIKFINEKGNALEILKTFISIELLIDLYFDESTQYYEDLITNGYINNSFEYSIYYDESYGHILFNVDTNNVDKFFDKIKSILQLIQTNEIKESDFLLVKRLYQAKTIKRFNSLEYIANSIIEAHNDGHSLFDYFNLLNEITIEDVKKVRELFDDEYIATFVIFPSKKG